MAQVPYKATPSVEPTAAPPPDYFHLEANPERFAAAGRGLQQLGESVSKVGDLWGEIQTDSQINGALKEGDAAVEKYRALRGQDALSAQQSIREETDKIVDRYGSQLSPVQKHRFDNAVRPYQSRYWNGMISSHAISQGYEFTKQTNADGEQLALSHAASNYNNPVEIETARRRALMFATKQLQADGQGNNPEAVQHAQEIVDSRIYGDVAEAMFAHNAPGGYEYAKAHEKELGLRAAPILDKFRARAEAVTAEQRADLLTKINGAADPIVRRGIIDANRGVLGEQLYKSLTGEPQAAPTGATPSNVVPIRPGVAKPGEAPADTAARLLNEEKQKVTGQPAPQSTAPVSNPTPRLPNESPQDWIKRHSSQNSSPATAAGEKVGALPFGEEQKHAPYSPAQSAIARAIDSRADKDLEVRKLPGNVLETARDVALHSGPNGLQQFMKEQGHPKSGNWCGEFAAAVVKSAGGTPPKNPAIASNWRNWGQLTADPKPGDIAVRRGAPTGQTGSHVTFVEDYSPAKGTFTAIGGNQTHVRQTFRIADFEFRNGMAEQKQAAQ